MKHEMKLQNNPFQSIKNKTKTIEMRLFDEKRQLIKTNDLIEFTNQITSEKITTRVINLYKYSSFAELYQNHNKVSLGYKENEEAKPNDMEQYYSKEEQANYGVIGIEIELI